MKRIAPTLWLFVLIGALVMAQSRSSRRGWGGYGEGGYPRDGVRTAREIPTHSTGTPVWTNPNSFPQDVHVCPHSLLQRLRGRRLFRGYGAGWKTDMPDSDPESLVPIAADDVDEGRPGRPAFWISRIPSW
jgi:hypothetical protein